MSRTHMIKIRVTLAEKQRMEAKARASGLSLSDLVRRHLRECRLRQTPEEKERVRQLARVGNNLNQLARWVNAHKGHVESVDVLLYLEQLWEACRGGPPCI